MDCQQSFSKLKLLIVEDDEDQAFLEKEKLEINFPDSTIDIVHDADECLKKNFSQYDLILLDLNLPDIFGLDLLDQIRISCDVPVIIVTGDDDISLAIKALKSGAYDYIIKSSNAFDVLPVVVENVIKNHLTKKDGESMHDRLIQSDKLASIGKLVSGVAHEINNPLTTILGFADILLMQSENASRDKLEKIRDSALQCKKTVENLLSFAREHKIERELLSVDNILERALSLWNNNIKICNIKVEKNFEKPSPCIVGDKFHLQQVFVNIISNACHALENAKTKTLTITTETNMNSVFIKFADTGQGISEEHLNKIFDPFFTTKEIGKGAGIGLSIGYGIIKEHSGEIHAESRVGEGTTFTIELPRSFSSLSNEIKSRVNWDVQAFQNLSILVVDDEESICDLYKEALSVGNNAIHFALSGFEAFDKLISFDFDVIILDLRMPEIDGMQIYNFVQSNKPHLLENILICTGDVMSQDIKEFLKGINNKVLNKPFSLLDLRDAILGIIEKRKSSDSLRSLK